MYLKTIKLAGFKSFVDSTVIPVRSNMNAVVGPNGCGKSNIVDAIRWVIGESSAKQLRGQSMSDVIFNGTTTRNAVGKASVELHFDNSANRLTGEYAAYTDIVIRREVERDGQSRYSLNGTGCRRKDILDIFLGTGLGPRSYSIIEQGMISRLIEAKPEDIRHYFEEVAGISKYKERRRETENRIHHTQDNLARLNDIRDELTKQLRHLKRQANAAERYQVYKNEKNQLAGQIKALQYQALQEKFVQINHHIREQETQREQHVAALRHHETEIEKTKLRQEEATDAMQSVQKNYYGLGEEIARLEQQIKSHQDQLATWQKELTRVNLTWNELSESTTEYREQITDLESEVSRLIPERGQILQVALNAKNDLGQAEENMQNWQQSWDSFQDKSSQLTSQVKVTETKIGHLQEQLKKLKTRETSLSTANEAINLLDLKTELAPAKQKVEALTTQLSDNKAALCASQEKILSAREQQNNLQHTMQNVRRELQKSESDYAKLDGLQQAALGRTDQEILAWLKANNLENNRRFGQEINVEAGWEKAVETVLSGYFDAVCVEDTASLVQTLSQVTSGRVMLLDKSVGSNHSTITKPNALSSKVECAWPFEQWLRGILVAESEQAALEAREHLEDDESIITPEGVWFGKNWIRVSKVKDPQSGIIARESELKKLTVAISTQAEKLACVEQQSQKNREALQQLENNRDELQATQQLLTRDLTDARAYLNKKELQLDNTIEQSKRLDAELAEIKSQISTLQKDEAVTIESRERLQAQQHDLTQTRQALLEERDKRRAHLQQKREIAHQKQKFADELEVRISSSESQLALLQQTLQRDEKQLHQLKTRRDDLTCRLNEDDSPLLQLNNSLQQKLATRLDREKQLSCAQSRLDEMRAQIKVNEAQKQEICLAIEDVQNTIQQLKMDAQEGVIRSQTITEQLDKVGLELDAVIASLPEHANIKQWQDNLNQVEEKITRLGPINLAAIDEHKDATERKAYLDKQYDDLTGSLEMLQSAIAKIDRETKHRFRETFDKVNEGFQTIFPRVFGGGRAELELSESNLLAAGIHVKAQPPGKRNASIHMLSGGEKALTAISLVFAMFALNPAPFCILDEVDAPLDDLNVGRFCQLVKEMSSDTQFLIISHNKVTIETADHLMGVTMQEPGVSRLVAVDMAEALEMVEAA